jgi:hypothetical protein
MRNLFYSRFARGRWRRRARRGRLLFAIGGQGWRNTSDSRLHLEPGTYALVTEAAEREAISASSFMRRAIIQALRRDGYARRPKERKVAEATAAA